MDKPTVEFLYDENHPDTPFLLFTSGELDGIVVQIMHIDFVENDETLLQIDTNILSPGKTKTLEDIATDENLKKYIHEVVGSTVVEILERAINEDRKDDTIESTNEREVRS